MENLGLKDYYSGKRVLVTGTTGFKGSWLAIWLKTLGAEVYGLSLKPTPGNENFSKTNLDEVINQSYIDIRDIKNLKSKVDEINPHCIFHLAAQPIVYDSYIDPINNYTTNVIGTLNIFESIKNLNSLDFIINVTSDKCYRNIEKEAGYKEDDKLGGLDPYSCSKSCAELISQSYIYNIYKDSNFGIANVRAGNVIGGGDLSNKRLFTDIINAIRLNRSLSIRNPNATRPWQYVLEPLHGYLKLGKKLFEDKKGFSGEWNFGPNKINNVSVQQVLKFVKTKHPSLKIEYKDSKFHEAKLLYLDSNKAKELLGWETKLGIKETINYTLEDYSYSNNLIEERIKRIDNYEKL